MMGHTQKFLGWQVDQIGCNCVIHRYHVAHICVCGEIISHSQGNWDTHKFHGGVLDFDAFWYKHDDTIKDVIDRYVSYGFHMPWIENSWEIYNTIVDKHGG